MSLKRIVPCVLALCLLQPVVAQNDKPASDQPSGQKVDEPVGLVDPATAIDAPAQRDKKKGEGNAMPEMNADMTAGMTPEQIEMMQAGMQRWAKHRTPNEAHTQLASLVGDWDMSYSVGMGPGMDQRMSMSGKARFTMTLGGRYLMQEVDIDMGEMGTMKGLGLIGYDNRKQQYQSVWLDESSTGMMVSNSEGGIKPGAAVPSKGSFYDPYLDQESETREQLTVNADGTMTFSLDVHQPRDGSWWDMLKITYTRAGSGTAAK